jgi:hypothetical protein
MQGPEMRDALHRLARDFGAVAVPKHGRYAAEPRAPKTARHIDRAAWFD